MICCANMLLILKYTSIYYHNNWMIKTKRMDLQITGV